MGTKQSNSLNKEHVGGTNLECTKIDNNTTSITKIRRISMYVRTHVGSYVRERWESRKKFIISSDVRTHARTHVPYFRESDTLVSINQFTAQY